MPKFGLISEARLETCHPDLQAVMREVIKLYDITIVCGHRGQEDQDRAFKEGNSDAPWPRSKHNRIPSLAVDVAPWPIDWKDIPRFWFMGGIIMGVAKGMGIKLRWGRDWDMDMDFRDQKLNDFPHFELVP
jgi:peptidoglycan L-alanyl-D-glutamate endopeptidase CwlK